MQVLLPAASTGVMVSSSGGSVPATSMAVRAAPFPPQQQNQKRFALPATSNNQNNGNLFIPASSVYQHYQQQGRQQQSTEQDYWPTNTEQASQETPSSSTSGYQQQRDYANYNGGDQQSAGSGIDLEPLLDDIGNMDLARLLADSDAILATDCQLMPSDAQQHPPPDNSYSSAPSLTHTNTPQPSCKYQVSFFN